MCVFLLFICVFVLVKGGFWSKKTGTVFHVAQSLFASGQRKEELRYFFQIQVKVLNLLHYIPTLFSLHISKRMKLEVEPFLLAVEKPVTN